MSDEVRTQSNTDRSTPQSDRFDRGIRQPLSFHTNRHSFGTLTLKYREPIESIAKIRSIGGILSTNCRLISLIFPYLAILLR